MYVYEKQYIDFTHGLLASYELERGTGVNKDTLQEKNSLLKEESFPAVEVVDSLMRILSACSILYMLFQKNLEEFFMQKL